MKLMQFFILRSDISLACYAMKQKGHGPRDVTPACQHAKAQVTLEPAHRDYRVSRVSIRVAVIRHDILLAGFFFFQK